ncbi:MAG: hypothetical protein R3Y09_11700 [Clostridia bacterium]
MFKKDKSAIGCVGEEERYNISMKVNSFSNIESFHFGIPKTADANVDIYLELSILDVFYDNKQNSHILHIKSNENEECQKGINLIGVGSRVKEKFNDEMEVRWVGNLTSTKKVEIDDMSHIFVYLDFSEINLDIEFGKNIAEKDRNEIHDLLENIKKQN